MCNECGKDYPIVNKKYGLCNECNFKRTHKGHSRSEVYAQRASLKPAKKPYIIKQVTKRQGIINDALSEVKRSVELEAIHSDMYYCWGCGHSHPGLDKSHILSVKQRSDLQLDPENINLFCRDCHNAWESWSPSRMIMLLSFEKDMRYIREKDQETFNKILTKMQEYLAWNVDRTTPTINAIKKYLKIFL